MIVAQVIGVEHLQANLARLGKDTDDAARKVASDGSLLVRKLLVAHLTGIKGSDPLWGTTGAEGDALGVRSGDTRRSISPGGLAATFRAPGGRWSASVGSDKASLAFHEHGGTISGSPMLKIPTAAALRANGTSRFPGMSARDIPGAFIYRGKGGGSGSDRAWIAVPKGDSIELLYLLKRSVTLRPRRIFATTVREAGPGIAAIGNLAVSVATRRANA